MIPRINPEPGMTRPSSWPTSAPFSPAVRTETSPAAAVTVVRHSVTRGSTQPPPPPPQPLLRLQKIKVTKSSTFLPKMLGIISQYFRIFSDNDFGRLWRLKISGDLWSENKNIMFSTKHANLQILHCNSWVLGLRRPGWSRLYRVSWRCLAECSHTESEQIQVLT